MSERRIAWHIGADMDVVINVSADFLHYPFFHYAQP